MALLDARSEVVVDDDGWVWLRPRRASLRRRQMLAWTLLALALAAGAGGVAFLEPLAGGLLAVASLLVAVALARVSTRGAHTRAGACAAGLLLQMGPRVVQAGWSSLASVRVERRGPRGRLVVAADQGPVHRTGATFDLGPLAAWVAEAGAAAGAAGRSVRVTEGGAGFDLGP